MRYTIRPNDQNPEWPTSPNPKVQERYAAQNRNGCSSMNIDWLRMVNDCRNRYSTSGTEKTYAWIDMSDPNKNHTITVEIQTRYGPYEELFPGCGKSRYVYVTCTISEGGQS